MICCKTDFHDAGISYGDHLTMVDVEVCSESTADEDADSENRGIEKAIWKVCRQLKRIKRNDERGLREIAICSS